MATISKNRRSQLLVESHFQKSFLGFTLMIAALVTAVYYFANLYFFNAFVERGQNIGLASDHVFFKFIDEQQRSMNLIFAVTAVISIALIIFFGLYMSNRVAGPVHQLKVYLKKVKAGENPEPLKFRSKDYFRDLAKAVNDVVGK